MSSPYEYIGKTPVIKDDLVEVLVEDDCVYTVEVEVPLATQFFASDQRFYFYSDEGITWRLLKQTSQE